jgi:hypothetical protein
MIAKKIKVRFCAAAGFTSWLIEWDGASAFSHMANFLADGRILDARVDDPCGNGCGVQIRPGNYLDSVKRWIDVEIDCTADQARDWELALLSQEGKPYDKTGIVDFITGSYKDRNWRSESAWFCDELGIWAQEQAGICPRLTAPTFKLTPGAACLIDIALGGRIVASKGFIRRSSGVLSPTG